MFAKLLPHNEGETFRRPKLLFQRPPERFSVYFRGPGAGTVAVGPGRWRVGTGLAVGEPTPNLVYFLFFF